MAVPLLRMSIEASKKQFFIRDDIISKMDKAEHAVTYWATMLVKKIAQRSMRSGGKKGKHSLPGQPPRYHATRLLRDKLFGVYDEGRKTGIIGPALLNGAGRRNRGKTVPETLEDGGEVEVREAQTKDGEWSRRAMKWADVNKLATRVRIAKIEPRPYMWPAYEKAKPKIMERWRNALHRFG